MILETVHVHTSVYMLILFLHEWNHDILNAL